MGTAHPRERAAPHKGGWVRGILDAASWNSGFILQVLGCPYKTTGKRGEEHRPLGEQSSGVLATPPVCRTQGGEREPLHAVKISPCLSEHLLVDTWREVGEWTYPARKACQKVEQV